MAGFALALTASPAHESLGQVADSVKRGAVAGVVSDTAGRAVPRATVRVLRHTLSVATDDSGRFRIAGVPAGRADLDIVKIGFKPASRHVVVIGDSTSALIVRLDAVQTLPSVDVTASPRLERTGYFERQRAGFGSYITPARIDSLSKFVHRPSALFRDVRGVLVRCERGRCYVESRRGDCLNIFVNGNPIPVPSGEVDETVGLTEVYAIEVYERQSLVPIDFVGKARSQTSKYGTAHTRRCGAIVIWTRNFAGPR